MGEYAYDFTGENAHDGPSLNPHDPGHMSGGSSGGSGTAVAAGMVAASLGSDTNGSIRVPSSFCGLFGLKPTFGRLSRAGTFPFCASLDHLGPLARSAADLAADPRRAAGRRPRRPGAGPPPAGRGHGARSARASTGSASPSPAATSATRNGRKPMPRSTRSPPRSASRREVIVPEAARARAAAYVITTAEVGDAPPAAPPDPRRRLRPRGPRPAPVRRDGPGAWVIQAQRFRAWFREAMREVFAEVDVILAPATPFPAPQVRARRPSSSTASTLPLRPNIGIFTQPISFIGLPVVAVPVWLDGATAADRRAGHRPGVARGSGAPRRPPSRGVPAPWPRPWRRRDRAVR